MNTINGRQPHQASLLQRYPKTVLFGLLVVCIAPFLLAHVLYLLGWHPANKVNQGALLEQPIAISSLKWQPIKPISLQDRWLLIVASKDECDATCEKNIKALKQVQIVLGKNSYRVERALILIGGHHDMIKTLTQKDARLGVYETLQKDLKSGDAYICDPKGNIIFQYQAPINQDAIFKDIKRLLEYSHIG